MQPAVRVQNAQQTEAGSKHEYDRGNGPTSEPAIDELMIRRIMAALMVEE